MLASFAFLAWLSFRPPAEARQVAAVFAPTVDLRGIEHRLHNSGMHIVRGGGLANVAVVDLGTGDAAELYDRGAWLLADPVAVAGCFTQP